MEYDLCVYMEILHLDFFIYCVTCVYIYIYLCKHIYIVYEQISIPAVRIYSISGCLLGKSGCQKGAGKTMLLEVNFFFALCILPLAVKGHTLSILTFRS